MSVPKQRPQKNAAAVTLAKRRAVKLSRERRTEIARKAALARWRKKSQRP